MPAFAWVLLATCTIAVLPAAVVWWLRASGALTSYVLVAAVGLAISLAVSYAGHAFWQTRPGSRDLLFSELMIWGYARRRYTERRLASARAVLGALSNAQRRRDDGLSPERQAKLLERLARAMDARDPKTHGHSRRVARYSWLIATRMNLPREQVARIRTAAAIHDVGKIETPDAVLNKAGSLTADEYEIIKRHAAAGGRMAEVLRDEELTACIRHHHERLDGTGYPDRLGGEGIPLGARIIAVADTFDAMTANRPYRSARTHKQALDVLRQEAGTKLDPAAVRAFLSRYTGRRSLSLWAWVTSLPERLLSQLTTGAVGAGSVAKAVVLAAVAGTFAAGAAGLAHPPGRAAVHRHAAASAPAIRAAGARATGAPPLAAERLPGSTARHRITRAGAPARHASVSRPTPSGRPSPATGGTAGGLPQSPGQEGAAPAGRGAQEATTRGTVSEGSSTGTSERHTSATPGGSGSGTQETSATRPEAGAGKSEGTPEKSSGKPEEAKGKSGAGVGGVVEEVKGTAGGVVEEVKGKVEQTKGKVEEIVGLKR